MGKVRWTAEAASWLQDIHDYIAERDPVAATRVVRGIYERIQVLRRFPESDTYMTPNPAIIFAFCCTDTTGSHI